MGSVHYFSPEQARGDVATAASDIYAPVAGEVVAANEALVDAPEGINSGAYGAGWLFKVRLDDAADLDGLRRALEEGGAPALRCLEVFGNGGDGSESWRHHRRRSSA